MEENCKCTTTDTGCNMTGVGLNSSAPPAATCSTKPPCPRPPQDPLYSPDCEEPCDCGCD